MDRRHVVRWRRKRLPNGKYLQIAVTKEAGPKGGHTLAYVQSSRGAKKTYPAVETTTKARVKRRTRKARVKRG